MVIHGMVTLIRQVSGDSIRIYRGWCPPGIMWTIRGVREEKQLTVSGELILYASRSSLYIFSPLRSRRRSQWRTILINEALSVCERYGNSFSATHSSQARTVLYDKGRYPPPQTSPFYGCSRRKWTLPAPFIYWMCPWFLWTLQAGYRQQQYSMQAMAGICPKAPLSYSASSWT